MLLWKEDLVRLWDIILNLSALHYWEACGEGTHMGYRYMSLSIVMGESRENHWSRDTINGEGST
jgi:hypothetical protein